MANFAPSQAAQIVNDCSERMLGSLAHRGMDGRQLSRNGNVVLGFQNFWTTPESSGVSQPLTTNDGYCSIVFDGRLDNRAHLIKFLEPRAGDEKNLSDAELVLRLYVSNGKQFISWLVGAFALVIYDRHIDSLLCARDPTGDRTLFYARVHDTFLVASEECALLSHPMVSNKPDTTRLLSFLTFCELPPDRTFFSAIKELRPGYLLVCDENSQSLTPFWQLELNGEGTALGYPEFAEEYRFLLKQSVEARLRTIGPPAALVSGGLDSTPVAAIVAGKLKESGERLDIFSWAFDDFPEADERRFVDVAGEGMGAISHYVDGDDCWSLENGNRWLANPNGPEENLFRALKHKIYKTVGEAGHRVLFVGASGDLMYTGVDSWLPSYLKCHGSAATLRLLGGFGLRGAVREVYGSAMNYLPRSFTRSSARSPYPWLNPWARKALAEVDEFVVEGGGEVARPAQLAQLLGLRTAHNVSMDKFYSHQAGLDVRDPYRDIRLIQFMLSVPACCLRGKDGYKQICREATEGLLHDKIRYRKRGGDLSALALKGLKQLFAENISQVRDNPGHLVDTFIDQRWLRTLTAEQLQDFNTGAAFWATFLLRQWELKLGGLADEL